MKLLIVNNNMHIGGIQKALLNMLKEISESYDITLMLFNPEGELMADIPQTVKIISGNKYTRIMGMSSDEAHRKGLLTFVWRSFWAAFTRAFGIKYTYKILSRFQKINEEFDVAVSYMQNSCFKVFYGGCNEFVLNSVKAGKKFAYLHCDFKNYYGNNPYNRSLYKDFKKIVCVSEGCRNAFLEICPQYEDKTVVAHNLYDITEIKKLSKEYPPKLFRDTFNIFTCARISREKGIMRVIPMIARLKKSGYNVCWYVAGDGSEMQDAIKLSNEMSAEVVFLGMLKNPYPYFKNADLLLVPSYNEAAPMVFGEAMCFNTPILTTNTTSAKELVEEFGAGIVVENTDEAIEIALNNILNGNAKLHKSDFDLKKLNLLAMSEFEACLR